MTSLKYSPGSDSNPENQMSRIHDNFFTKELLKRLDKYNDNLQISLQESIPILYELNIFQELTSIPEAKKRLTQQSKPNHRLQIQARFIYNLWKLISKEFISMRYFKEIVSMFISEETSDLAQKLEQIFQNEGSLIIQILAIWEAMLQKSHHSSYQQFKQSSVLTQQGVNFNTSNDFHKYSRKQPSKHNNHHQYSTNSMQANKISLNSFEKQNERQMNIKYNNQNYTQRNKTRRQNIEDVKNQIYNSNLYQIPVLSVQREKQLVNRLYVVNKYERYQQLKKMQDEQRRLKQMQQCTFRPNIDKQKKRPSTTTKTSRNQSKTQSKIIPGFQKAIQRMKVGQQKTKQLKQKLQLRNINVKQNKDDNTKAMIPPKFLTRQNKKQQKKVLFTIQFDIGRHKLTCKIHQNQSAEQLSKNIQSIYSLKQDSYQEIKYIIQQQMERYFQLNHEGQNHQQEQIQNDNNQCQQNLNQSRQKSHNFIFC